MGRGRSYRGKTYPQGDESVTRPIRLIRADLTETVGLCNDASIRLSAAITQLRQSQAGYPTGGDGTGSSSGISDLASRLDDHGNIIDDAGKELDQLSHEAERLHRLARSVYDTCQRWSRPPTNAQKAKDAGAGDPGCEICARFTNNQDQPHWSPAHVEDSTVKNNLERPHRLCRFHYDFILRHGRMATKRETTDHLSGKRVRVKQAS